MRRVWILCLMILAFCVGCGESEPPVNNQPDDQVSAPADTPTTPTAPEKVDNSNNEPTTKESDAINEETTANEGALLENESSVRAVFIGSYKSFSPVAFFHDGESLLTYAPGDLGWVSPVEDPTQQVGSYADSLFSFLGVGGDGRVYENREYFKQPWADSLATQSFHYASAGDQKIMGIISFEELFYDSDYAYDRTHSNDYSYNYSYGNRFPPVKLAINTDVPFIDYSKHIQYTPKDQEQLPAVYLDHIKKKLQSAGLEHTPVIISDIFYYDFDGDGKDEAIVIADNHPHFNDSNPIVQPEQLAYYDGIGVYIVMTLFSQTMGTIDLQEYFIPLDDYFPLSPEDLSIKETVLTEDALYLYHENNTILSTNIGSDPPDWDYYKAPIICDFNGDGLFDLGILADRMSRTLIIYLQENKQLNKLCHLYLPM